MSFYGNLLQPSTGSAEGQVGWIHNGPVLAWNWMCGIPYELQLGELSPVYTDEWPRIASDALAATLSLLQCVHELGGPPMPSELTGWRAPSRATQVLRGARA